MIFNSVFVSMILYSVLEKCVKVGEGTYGEVYKINDGVEDVALKVNGVN